MYKENILYQIQVLSSLSNFTILPTIYFKKFSFTLI